MPASLKSVLMCKYNNMPVTLKRRLFNRKTGRVKKEKVPALKTQLKTALARIGELEAFIERGKTNMDDLRKVLGLSSYESYNVVFQKIISALEYRKRNEGAQDVFSGIVSNENSKLWYLLRAITGDPTLKNSRDEANHENVRRMDHSPYDKPRF